MVIKPFLLVLVLGVVCLTFIHLLVHKAFQNRSPVYQFRELFGNENIQYDFYSRFNISSTPGYIKCNQTRADLFYKKHKRPSTKKDESFRKSSNSILKQASRALGVLNVTFFLDGGTLLGWLRQCDVIPQSADVDIGVFIDNYTDGIIQSMQKQGFKHRYSFGLKEDSLEYSFVLSGVKLDIFFFYKEKDHYWKGSVTAYSGKKYKYTYPPFKLCWTKLLDVPVHVPCKPEKFITSIYGPKWTDPVKKWGYEKDPKNMKFHGYWTKSQMKKAIVIKF